MPLKGRVAGVLAVLALATGKVVAAALPATHGGDATGGVAPRVHLAAGDLSGSTQQGAHAFLGIPYARPPVGALRWRPPQPAQAWRGTHDATRFGPNCLQGAPAPFGPWTAEFLIDPSMAEDCLYLNVWAPARTMPGPLPVLVWIHGGGFGSGSGSIPIYNGAVLAAQGAIVVTINYRLGVLGFLAHPGLSAESAQHVSGNYGLLDIIAALRWVHSNIARFGGNPRRVTVAGQSAGAEAVLELMASPRARGLFAGAIAESGVMGMHLVPLHAAEQQGQAMSALAGLHAVEQLRALPAGQVAALRLPGPAGEAPIEAASLLRPVIDGAVLPADPHVPGARTANDVPLLTGYNADEGGGVAPHAVGLREFEPRVRADFGAASARLLALYAHEDDAQADASWRQLDRDATMADVLAWCARRAAEGGAATFAYLFDQVLPGPEEGRFRSFHTAEVPYVFGALDEGVRPYRAEDRRVAALVQGYWLGFIATGRPDRPGQPPWPRCSAHETKVMGLGLTPGMRPAVSSAGRQQALQERPAP
jgi:para-nitrobenzyl esterase